MKTVNCNRNKMCYRNDIFDVKLCLLFSWLISLFHNKNCASFVGSQAGAKDFHLGLSSVFLNFAKII